MKNEILTGDCREMLPQLAADSVSACITDPPYNYEFIGHKWDDSEIRRRIDRVKEGGSTLVRNVPYGSGLAGGVRNAKWYQRVRDNILDYQNWCFSWSLELFRVCKPGAFVAAFNSTRSVAHLQIALERAGFYTRDCLVYRRASGIPKGLNFEKALKKRGISNAEKWSGWHSCLRNDWEAIVLVQKPLINNYFETLAEYGVGLIHAVDKDGSFQSNILEKYPRDRDRNPEIHCTIKPQSLMEKLVDLFVPPGNEHIVLDPFAGSGTTLLAAKLSGRSYIGIEIVPEYVQCAQHRLANAAPVSVASPSARSKTLPLFS